jgi:hypothetical protein
MSNMLSYSVTFIRTGNNTTGTAAFFAAAKPVTGTRLT